ncbi:MAG: porin [Burkholderiales bacterium]|nr:porin [Burkholderiales bacterium]
MTLKKSLVTLAVLASCGATMAQSSVAMFGLLDVGIEKIPGASSRVSTGRGTFSSFGFRGVEDLGGGLQASFLIDTGLSTDKAGFSTQSGLASIGNRATWLSMGGKELGKFSLGRGYAGAYFTLRRSDPTGRAFGQGTSGAMSLYSNNIQLRFDNLIRYETPNWNGFSADLALGLQGDAQSDTARPTVDAASATTAGSATRNISSADTVGYTLGTQYANGPVFVGVTVLRTPGVAGFGGAASSNSKNTWTLGASYDLSVVKLFAGFESDRRYSSNRSAGHIGVSAPLGAGKIMAWYGQDQNGGTTLNDKVKSGSVAYTYNLSKRTDVYAAVIEDSVGGAGVTANNSRFRDGTTTQVGIRHRF